MDANEQSSSNDEDSKSPQSSQYGTDESGLYIYKCDCGRRYLSRSGLTQHQIRIHHRTKTKTFSQTVVEERRRRHNELQNIRRYLAKQRGSMSSSVASLLPSDRTQQVKEEPSRVTITTTVCANEAVKQIPLQTAVTLETGKTSKHSDASQPSSAWIKTAKEKQYSLGIKDEIRLSGAASPTPVVNTVSVTTRNASQSRQMSCGFPEIPEYHYTALARLMVQSGPMSAIDAWNKLNPNKQPSDDQAAVFAHAAAAAATMYDELIREWNLNLIDATESDAPELLRQIRTMLRQAAARRD
jgi:hypothetical protein